MFGFTLAGLFVGFAVGATGVGGGALMTPILILAFGIVPATAVGTDLLYAAITKGFGVVLHRKAGTVDWRVVGLMAAGSAPATVVTSLLLGGVHGEGGSSDSLILTVLAIAIVVTSLLTLARAPLQYWMAQRSTKTAWQERHPKAVAIATVVFGALIGVLVTISSVGAGVIGAMVLMSLYPKMRAISVVGTDLAHAVPLTLLAGLMHYVTLGTVDFTMLGYLLLGSLPGIYFGTKVGFRLPDRILRPTIAIALLLIGCSLLFKL